MEANLAEVIRQRLGAAVPSDRALQPDLLTETLKLWESTNAETKANEWARRLIAARDGVSEAGQRFHEPNPLRIISTYSRAVLAHPSFSVRYLGQEVGELVVGDEVILRVSNDAQRTNLRDFNLHLKGNAFPWRDRKWAAQFRKHFAELDSHKGGLKLKSPEACVQGLVWDLMANSAQGGFHRAQPVTLTPQARFPFQCPVPLSANTGRPRASRKGNIDVLAKVGTGRGTHLAVWELKKPKVCGEALAQAYIYAVQIALMLRSSEGNTWNHIFQFEGDVKKNLIIDTVVVLTRDREKELNIRLSEFSSPWHVPDLGLAIRPFAAWYDWDQGKGTLALTKPVPLF